MNNKIYVGNLDWGMTVDQLRETFAEAGEIQDAVIITDKYSGRSKGFGFVQFNTDEEAQKAIEMFNGKDLNGRNIVVNVARPREDSPEGGAPRSEEPAQ